MTLSVPECVLLSSLGLSGSCLDCGPQFLWPGHRWTPVAGCWRFQSAGDFVPPSGCVTLSLPERVLLSPPGLSASHLDCGSQSLWWTPVAGCWRFLSDGSYFVPLSGCVTLSVSECVLLSPLGLSASHLDCGSPSLWWTPVAGCWRFLTAGSCPAPLPDWHLSESELWFQGWPHLSGGLCPGPWPVAVSLSPSLWSEDSCLLAFSGPAPRGPLLV